MNKQRHHLDDAIDHVAKRLTHVDDDAQFASRVIAALPERVSWFPWLFGWLAHAWAPRLAMFAIVAGAFAFWNSMALPRSAGRMGPATEVTPSASPLASVANNDWPQLAAAVRFEQVAPAIRLARPSGTRFMEPVEPFEGLPPVAAPTDIAMRDVTAPALPAEGALSVPSLVIADLPLTAESLSLRD